MPRRVLYSLRPIHARDKVRDNFFSCIYIVQTYPTRCYILVSGQVSVMITMEEAINLVMGATALIACEQVGFVDALGRVLAEDVVSDIDMPPFHKATMDGYAVIGADIDGAREDSPVVLEVIEEIPAGSVPTMDLTSGKASRIMTGAPVPAGADTVVMIEDTTTDSGGKKVSILASNPSSNNIAPLGEDVRKGHVVLNSGSRLRPPEIGILAAVGKVDVKIHRQPIVGIISTGSEIVEPHNAPKVGQIRNSNGYSMAAQIVSAGARAKYLGIVADDPGALQEVIFRGLKDCDIVLLSGGVSAGLYDLVQGAMKACGVTVQFDRIKMKPGKPLTFGTRNEKLIFGLPGNPVSSVVGLELLVYPAIRKMQGFSELYHQKVKGFLRDDFEQVPGRKQYVPARTVQEKGQWHTSWVGHHGSADLFSLAGANSLFVVESETQRLDAGSEVEIVLIAGW
jgi:molybdopterin molybdotransferase